LTVHQKTIAMSKKLDAITSWQNVVYEGPRFNGVPDLYAGTVEAIAFKCSGYDALRLMVRLAQRGHSGAIRDLVKYSCEMVDSIEDIGRTKPELLRELACGRADWPVMLCRHETSNKNVSTYLDGIGLGLECVINADGQRVAKYSLRTPINRFVWRTLKQLRFSIGLLSDKPVIARIDLDALPKLTKATAKIWADKALMPYIALCEDFSQVPEFRTILSRPGVKTRGQQRREIRKDVIRALQSLAPMP